jgi:hypothetical protein
MENGYTQPRTPRGATPSQTAAFNRFFRGGSAGMSSETSNAFAQAREAANERLTLRTGVG